MISAQFDGAEWIERVLQLLPPLAKAQAAFLRQYQERYGRVIDLRDGGPPPFPLEDLRLLYDEVRDSRPWDLQAHYAPLRAVLDPVRHALLTHPTLKRVALTGRLIGDNRFSMEIPGSGGDIYMGTLIAGLMARAAELPEDGFRTAVRELNAFLSPIGDGAAADTLGGLDEGCDVLLFHGLTLSERIEVEDGMVLLPYEEVLRFVDEKTVRDFAPSGTGFQGWQATGAVARPFRWRPELRRRGRLIGSAGPPSPPFFQEATVFLDLLAVSHATRVAPLAALSNRIDGSAGRLLGSEQQSPGFFYQSWSAEGFSGFGECPAISPEALAEALEAFRGRKSARYVGMAPIVTRLSEALARTGRFAVADRVQDVAMALERMYVLDEDNIGRKLRNRTARFLGADAASEERIRDKVRELYDVRSNIVHNRLHRLTPDKVHSAYIEGFDLARQSLFKLLRVGPPEDWAAARATGSQGIGTNRPI
ncbi:MAG: HEPN domain-containing protein [Rhodospirillaceae bacterium]|nr:HEPN domain-containing protein [Rhodospirillaceae bacterium]